MRKLQTNLRSRNPETLPTSLHPGAEPLARAISHRIKTTDKLEPFDGARVCQILCEITERMKSEVFGQVSSRQRKFLRRANRTIAVHNAYYFGNQILLFSCNDLCCICFE